MKKSGFVAIVGRSNVGKSTLLNAIVGSKIAITSPKPQTTRLPIHGILTREEGQIVFVDTPGIFKLRRDALTKKLLETVQHSLQDIDAVVYVVDPTREIGNEERFALKILSNIDKPKILVINKSDLHHRPYLNFYKDQSAGFQTVIELSALHNTHVESLVKTLFTVMPEGEFNYPEFQITNLPTRDWIAELIREKLFLRLRQEVPYSLQVEVTRMEQRKADMLYIAATISTTSDRYQRMIIGAGGRGIKEIGQAARKELEGTMNTKIFLDLTVAVDPHWIDRIA